MKRALKITGIISLVFVAIISLWATDNFIYPFKPETPNYTDVERVFARLQFPSEWKEISSSENKGLHGRGCDPFNSAGCFHKGKTFTVDDVSRAKENLKEILKTHGGCSGVYEEAIPEGNSNTDPMTATNISCQTSGGVIYRASTSQLRGQVGVDATTY
jgi:hypothetical protein